MVLRAVGKESVAGDEAGEGLEQGCCGDESERGRVRGSAFAEDYRLCNRHGIRISRAVRWASSRPSALLKLPKIDLARLVMKIAKHRAPSVAIGRLHGKTRAGSGYIQIEFAHDRPFAAVRRGVEKECPLGL